MLKKYLNFINEAIIGSLRSNSYVLCGSNFRNISPVKGKYARVVSRTQKPNPLKWYITLEFNEPLIDRRSGEPIETNIIEINQNQISNLISLSKTEYDRIMDGHTLKFESSQLFLTVIQNIKFRIIYKTYDVSYFDILDTETITFLPANKDNLVEYPDKYTSKMRQQTKINRVLKKLNDRYTDAEINDFGTKFKGFYKMISEDVGDKLRVVTGDLIAYWYNESNYLKEGGTLNSSCMRGTEANKRILSFYSKNPDKIALCILVDDNNKLLARALIWKLDSPKNVIFMDRIYYVRPEHEQMLMMYADKHNIKTKKSGYNKNKLIVNIPYLLSSRNDNPLPYLDTMKLIDNNTFSNYGNY